MVDFLPVWCYTNKVVNLVDGTASGAKYKPNLVRIGVL